MNFTAIDFETANYAATSACSVGLAKCVDGEITRTYQTLIKPPRLFFSRECVAVHGITAADVRTAPLFLEVWSEMREIIGDDTLVAHNAPFDRRVLEAVLEYYRFPPCASDWACTLNASRRFFREVLNEPLKNYQLSTVASRIGFSFRHHDSLEDALAAAKIMIHIQRHGGLK
ncbi:MAG: 3'-5' exonuclease [Planctomycetia bacterium]|nr:3'-5' exonuclease [Planctomycetia bacterium]